MVASLVFFLFAYLCIPNATEGNPASFYECALKSQSTFWIKQSDLYIHSKQKENQEIVTKGLLNPAPIHF